MSVLVDKSKLTHINNEHVDIRMNLFGDGEVIVVDRLLVNTKA
jgi:hypothetical protein